ncbi:MAG TPA: nitrogen regulation protein NR(II) [Sedimenticola sp.]|nr:nitrogen regulation protein NR(II) [Sedimenticola sp.]
MDGLSTSLNDDCRRILENMDTVVLLFDTELRLSYMNPAAEMLFQVSVRHMVGREAGSLIQCPNERVEANLTRALETGRHFTEREMTLPLSGRRSVTVDCTVIPLIDPDGAAGLLVEIRQIDRQLRLNREEKLLSQHQATRDLIRGLAHEIKNPLGGLRGAAQLLEQELGDPSLTEYTRIIIEEADRLQALVDGMLGPNKLPHFSKVNIHRLLERVAGLVLAESGEPLDIQRDYDPSIPDLYLDSDRIIQALLNIVRNAARALRQTEHPRIVLRTRILRQLTIVNLRHRLVVQIQIEDNGPGIPEAIREKLFFPMVAASEGGIGLGLSIAQSLIQRHGGLVECHTGPGRTIFNILLPMEHPNVKK